MRSSTLDIMNSAAFDLGTGGGTPVYGTGVPPVPAAATDAEEEYAHGAESRASHAVRGIAPSLTLGNV
ncbi:hypothetical protein GUJ93_ZPchr0013g35090 [Zizania palustris]|uniref:Uncharacterized protein n=1 Tax=Zizania palustris TaxID=103762 RepID=A0A8J5WWM6_ZIZPA|nr:hypothetical protein GUJ93_ZPchr0013g35090 [Zizania palustris]